MTLYLSSCNGLVCNKLSKENNVSYLIDNNGDIISDITDRNNGKEFVVYLDYKLHSKGIKKNSSTLFRRNRIQFFYNDTDYITLPVVNLIFLDGQLKIQY